MKEEISFLPPLAVVQVCRATSFSISHFEESADLQYGHNVLGPGVQAVHVNAVVAKSVCEDMIRRFASCDESARNSVG
jgi:hypothetical protein